MSLPIYPGLHPGTGLNDHIHSYTEYQLLDSTGRPVGTITACQICGSRLPIRSFPPNTCCVCFSTLSVEDLEPVTDEPGRVWDVCKQCAKTEREHGATF